MILALEIRDNVEMEDLDETDKKRLNWEAAVSNELEDLYNKQIELEEKIDNIAENPGLKSPNLNVTRQDAIDLDINDKVDALTDQINKLIQSHENEKKEMNKEINKLKIKIQKIEHENMELKQTNQGTPFNTNEVQMVKDYVNRQIEELELTQNEKIQNLNKTNHNHANTTNATKFKMNIPTFKGTEYERPLKFLNELEKYIAVMKPNDDVLLAIISQALLDNAQNWFYIIQNDINNYEDFVEKFKDQYWSETKRRNALFKFEWGQYYPGGKFTYLNYAIYIYGLAKELNLNLTEEQLATQIAGHFERSIKHAFRGQSVRNKETLFNILADFDEDEAKEKMKKQKIMNKEHKYENKTEDKTRIYDRTRDPNAKKSYQTNAIKFSNNKQQNKNQKQFIDKNKGAYPKRNFNRQNREIDEQIDVVNINENDKQDNAYALPGNAN